MARGWKRLVEIAAGRAGVSSFLEHRARPTSIVLAYHNIVPVGESAVGDLSLHVDQSVFADQLDCLLEGRRIVGLTEALAPRREGDDQPRVAITFDDAYSGAMTAGMEELKARGLPSTVFVAPGLLGTDGFWWDRLARPGEGLEAVVRDHALSVLSGRAEAVLGWADAQGRSIQIVPDHARPVAEHDLVPEALVPGCRLGSHTWSHPNLASLSRQEVDAELVRCRDWLAERSETVLDWLAYPYGLFGQTTLDATRELFTGGVAISGGLAEREGRLADDLCVVPRLNIPRGLSIDGLRLRLAGLLGG